MERIIGETRTDDNERVQRVQLRIACLATCSNNWRLDRHASRSVKCKRGDIKQRRDTTVVPPFLRGRWKKKEKRRKEKKRKEQNKIKPKGEKGNAGTKSIVKKIRARIFPLFPLFYVYTDRYRCPLEISLRFTFHFFFLIIIIMGRIDEKEKNG